MVKWSISFTLAALLCMGSWPVAAQQNSGWQCDRSRENAPVLKFRAGIGSGEFERFKAAWQGCFPQGHGGIHTIDLHSGGGSVSESLSIANYLVDRFRNKPPLLLTRVSSGSRCVSACTYLYLAGQRRIVESGASLEPHGFSGYHGVNVDKVMQAIAQQVTEKRQPICKVFQEVGERAWIRRLQEAGNGLGKALADRRLEWALEFVGQPVRECRDVERLVIAYSKLPPEKADLIAWIDSVMAITMPEVERAAALRSFRTHFAVQAGQVKADAAVPFDRPDRHLRWSLDAYLEGINAYLSRSGQGPRLKDIDAAVEDLRSVHDSAIGVASNLASGPLGNYLDTRRSDVDVPAFVKLMFSTSILYTRPLSREELCDHNLVNVGCN